MSSLAAWRLVEEGSGWGLVFVAPLFFVAGLGLWWGVSAIWVTHRRAQQAEEEEHS